MKRKAILIANSKKTESCQPFINDVNFLCSFLKSKNGGSWLKSEIVILINPTMTKVISIFWEVKEYFRFVYFSGHGCMSNGKQYLLIDNQLVNICTLKNKVARETIILDCCRYEYAYPDLINNYIILEQESKKEDTRGLYETLLKKNVGCFVAFVTKEGEYAMYIPQGSYFMHAFAEVIWLFKKVPIRGVVSVNEFLRQIDKVFKRFNLSQAIICETDCKGKYPFYIG